jgi:hypothetical protein
MRNAISIARIGSLLVTQCFAEADADSASQWLEHGQRGYSNQGSERDGSAGCSHTGPAARPVSEGVVSMLVMIPIALVASPHLGG